MTKIIKVVRNTDDGMMELSTPIVVGVDKPLDSEPESARFIDVSFHLVMKPFLLSLKSHFTTYDARNILKLPSTYSIRIYELLKQYERIGKRRFDLRELKEIIGVIEEIDTKGKKTYEDVYPLYGNFRQRVLLKAQEDLEKYTDIRFEFKPLKKGRTIKEVLFTIFPNTPERQDTERQTFQDGAQEELYLEFYPLVKKRVSEVTVRKWIQVLPEEKIRKGISYTLHQIDN